MLLSIKKIDTKNRTISNNNAHCKPQTLIKLFCPLIRWWRLLHNLMAYESGGYKIECLPWNKVRVFNVLCWISASNIISANVIFRLKQMLKRAGTSIENVRCMQLLTHWSNFAHLPHKPWKKSCWCSCRENITPWQLENLSMANNN